MRSSSGKRRLPHPATIAYALVAALAAPLLLSFVAALFFWQTASRFADYRAAEPSRLYGRALILRRGEPLSADGFTALLADAGYEPAPAAVAMPLGTVAQQGPGRFLVARRPPAGAPPPSARESVAEVILAGGRVAALRAGGAELEELALDPPLLASYYDPGMRECRAVAVERLPPRLVEAVLAAEDDSFFVHQGISATAILRAALVNLAAGRVRQGGSTITQQLARTLYLTRERSWARKYREALLSLMLEMRYSKRRLLEAYLNEVYMGQSGAVNLVGIGAAAEAYFGKPAERLELGEAALLAGMIRSPGDYAPALHPQRALARRNHVLRRMAALGWIEPQLAAQEERRPLGLRPRPLPAYGEVGYFADAMAQEARERYRIPSLAGQGYTLFSTLDRRDQRRALAALADGLEDLGPRGAGLQAALVSIAAADGSILAWVGGRDYGDNQFDRVGNARRQAGSVFKPVVYAAALRAGVNLTDTFLDAPVVVRVAGGDWRPRNDDERYRGEVSVRAAMEQSLNVPTVHLALAAGLPSIVDLSAEFGIGAPADGNPSLALGTVDVTPLELARVYAALAAGGLAPTPFGLTRVLGGDGGALSALPTPPPRRVLDEDTAFLVTTLLQGVVARGTGAGVRRLGLADRVAGKTGTSDDGRDAWFAGYSPERASVVWVGRDDNAPARLSGSRAALPIWTRFMAATRPPGGYRPWQVPSGVVSAEIDPETGLLATPACPQRRQDFFYAGRVPIFACTRHDTPVEWAFLSSGFPGGHRPGTDTVILLDARGAGGDGSWMALDRRRAMPPAEPPPRRRR